MKRSRKYNPTLMLSPLESEWLIDVRVALVAAEADTATPDRDYLGVCIPPPLSAADTCPDVDSESYKHIRLNVHSSDPLEKMIEVAPQLGGFRDHALKHIVFVMMMMQAGV